METNVLADAGRVTLSFIVDTEYILKNFPDPIVNCKSAVRVDAAVLSMISDIKNVASGYNTRDIKIKANAGDKILFNAEPKDYISKDLIQLSKIVPWIGRMSLLPQYNQLFDATLQVQNGNKPTTKDYVATIKRKGQEQLEIRFSVYTPSADGNLYQLHGNFYCDLLAVDIV